MFLKQTIFERLLKDAYKTSGIYVSHTLSEKDIPIYVIAGSWWCVWVGTEWITKEVKAAIIKLCGDLPDAGEAYKAAKDCPIQYEMDNRYDHALKEYEKCGYEVRKTRLLINNSEQYQVLQSELGKIYFIQKRAMDMIDHNLIDRDKGEHEPVGPHINENGKAVYWRNNACTVMVCLCDVSEEEQVFWNQVGKLKVI